MATDSRPGWVPVHVSDVVAVYDRSGKLLGSADIASIVPRGAEPCAIRLLRPVEVAVAARASMPGPLPMLLTVPQAADELGVSSRKVYELIRSGKLASLLLGPKIRRIRRTALEDYLARLETVGTEPLSAR